MIERDRLVSSFRAARRKGRAPLLTIVLSLVAWTCTGNSPQPNEEAPPTLMLGEFVDDYGTLYTIQADQWIQHPNARYHLRAWHTRDQFVVAQNDSGNPSDGSLWTRIDWIVFDDPHEYEWAFCYVAYQAQTQEDALAVGSTQRDTPRTGCNGFPFSRMKRVTPPNP